MLASLVGLIGLVIASNVLPGKAAPESFRGSSTAQMFHATVESVSAHHLVLRTPARERTYLVDPATNVCEESGILCRDSAVQHLAPGASVRVIVGTNSQGRERVSTVFQRSEAADVEIDSIAGDLLRVHDYEHGNAYTLAVQPSTIIETATGEVTGSLPSVAVGDRLYFTGVEGVVDGEPVTVVVRIL
jgi:hypothetical protein